MVVYRSWRSTVAVSKSGVIGVTALMLMSAFFWQLLAAVALVVVGLALTIWRLSSPKASGRTKDFSQWAEASQLAYNIPESPAFRSLTEHQEAVRWIYRLRHLNAAEISGETLLPIAFVGAVLRFIDGRPDDEGGAAVGARLKPRDPDPRNAAE